MPDDFIDVTGQPWCSPLSNEFLLGFCGGIYPGVPQCPPFCGGTPGDLPPPPSSEPIPPPAPPTPPPEEAPETPESPPPEAPADVEVIDTPLPPERPPVIVIPPPARAGDIPFFAAGLSAVPVPRPRRRPTRRPRRAPTKRPAPRRRPPPAPRIRPQTPPTPLSRVLARVGGVAARLLGGIGLLLNPRTMGPEPPSGSPIYGVPYGDRDTDPTLQLPGAGRLLDPGFDLETRARPIRPSPYVPAPLPTVNFPYVGIPGDPVLTFLGDPQPSPRTGGVPEAPPIPVGRPQPRPVPSPIAAPGLALDPLPFAPPAALPQPAPSPRPAPSRPPRVSPPPSTFTTIPQPGPGTLTLPLPQPTPVEATNKCDCPPKKKRKQKQDRTVCWRGTFVEKSKSLTKIRKERVPCRP